MKTARYPFADRYEYAPLSYRLHRRVPTDLELRALWGLVQHRMSLTEIAKREGTSAREVNKAIHRLRRKLTYHPYLQAETPQEFWKLELCLERLQRTGENELSFRR